MSNTTIETSDVRLIHNRVNCGHEEWNIERKEYEWIDTSYSYWELYINDEVVDTGKNLMALLERVSERYDS